jgi:NAD(P)-dependent dehydrogenase (short-subunit alcohol dehydrogenase family)
LFFGAKSCSARTGIHSKRHQVCAPRVSLRNPIQTQNIKVAVTGASQGIGASLVKGFREIGYGIVANWSRQWMQRAATTDRSTSSFDESSPSNRIGENRCLKKSILIAAASSVQRL